MDTDLNFIKETDRELELISRIKAQLEWDQETCLPSGGVKERSDQLSYLEGKLYDLLSDSEFGKRLEHVQQNFLENSSNIGAERDVALVRELLFRHRRIAKLPKALVQNIAKQSSINQLSWYSAKLNSDFSKFSPDLKETIKLLQNKIECIGYTNEKYDALLQEYEPGMQTKDLSLLFEALVPQLVDIVELIKSSKEKISTDFLGLYYSEPGQRRYSERLLKLVGFDHKRGRLDVSKHPFSTLLGNSDVRITTRFNENFLCSSLFGTLHEAGHGMYDLGHDSDLFNTGLSGGASLGIHESQSRFWENIIGRSYDFWMFSYPELQNTFPENLAQISLNEFYRAINRVQFTPIRVEADEVTYNLHIALRFQLERELVENNLLVDDLLEAWRVLSREYLFIDSINDSSGVLQDIHWPLFCFGYFPTYTLGNLYSAQFYKKMSSDLPDLKSQIQQGNFKNILKWLRVNIHAKGKIYNANDLCLKVTQKELDSKFYLIYLQEKYSELYGI